jgi:hypothetical protein
MGTFVLVHGTWAGAHGFRHVRRHLQAAGHEAFTPSLTAHARSSDAWNYREIASNHMVPSNRPAELAELLIACL